MYNDIDIIHKSIHGICGGEGFKDGLSTPRTASMTMPAAPVFLRLNDNGLRRSLISMRCTAIASRHGLAGILLLGVGEGSTSTSVGRYKSSVVALRIWVHAVRGGCTWVREYDSARRIGGVWIGCPGIPWTRGGKVCSPECIIRWHTPRGEPAGAKTHIGVRNHGWCVDERGLAGSGAWAKAGSTGIFRIFKFVGFGETFSSVGGDSSPITIYLIRNMISIC